MSFDVNAFKNAPWVHRTQDVPVPELASFFASDERPVWRVRNLTAPELARANNATSHLRRGAALAEALEADDTRGIIAATRELIGRGAARDPEIPRRLEMLTAASVEPACDLDLALVLCEHHCKTFYALTNAIFELSSQGSDLEKKAPPSGATPG